MQTKGVDSDDENPQSMMLLPKTSWMHGHLTIGHSSNISPRSLDAEFGFMKHDGVTVRLPLYRTWKLELNGK